MPRKPFDMPLDPELEAEGLKAVSLVERFHPLGRRALLSAFLLIDLFKVAKTGFI